MKAADRCPGLLRPHPAEDGALVRLRFPGGHTTADTLLALSGLARHFGHPELQLTSRAGLQLRGLPDPLPDGLTSAVQGLGLLPSPRHERVRNILASPLTGVAGGRADLRGLVHDLDRALLADPPLAALPGRFLFVLDDGRGDVSNRPFDLGYRARGPRDGEILVGGPDLGFPITAAEAVDALIRLAHGFVRARHDSGAWHVHELPGWLAEIDGLGPLGSVPTAAPPAAAPPAAELIDPDPIKPDPINPDPINPEPVNPEPIALGAVGGAASVAVPLGLLTARQTEAIARIAPGPVVITPWRGLVVPGGAAGLDALIASGLVADPHSPWSLLSACVGAPFCAKAGGSTRALADDLVAGHAVTSRTHISGCARRCGAPSGDHRDLLVPAAGAVAR